jgi:hypothetical protein
MQHRPDISGPRVALLLVFVFVAFALAGCGGKY